MTSIIYVLECTDKKYFVGKTKNIQEDLNKHFIGNGGRFTQQYKPIKCIEQYETEDTLLEDYIVKQYMIRHGTDNVRGGTYYLMNLTDEQIAALNREFITAKDACHKCGSQEHRAEFCDQKRKTWFGRRKTEPLLTIDENEEDEKACTCIIN
jgi:predicted GIY-YIG superfamily endonuclease